MNDKQQKHYNSSFQEIHDHRMEYGDYMVEYIMNIPVTNFSIKRAYAVYDQFQERLCQGELPDDENIIVKDKDMVIAEMKKKGEDIFIRIKTGKKWSEVRCPLEIIKFTDWWLYT